MTDPNHAVAWPLHLWNRKKEIDIYALENGNFVIQARLDDTSPLQLGVVHPHVMFAEIEFTPSLVIARARGEMTNHPYPECLGAIPCLDQLVGIQVGPGVTGQVLKVAGGISGCSHLTSLVLDIVNLAMLAPNIRNNYFAFPGPVIGDEELLKFDLVNDSRFGNRCIALNDASPVIKRVRASLGQAPS